MKLQTRLSFALTSLTTLALFSGCQTTAGNDALIGAGIGAIAGQVLGGDSASTVLGAGVGAGIGYVIGNEADKTKAAEMTAESERQKRVQAESNAASTREAAVERPSFSHSETGSLAGSRWNLVSLVPRSFVSPYTSKIIEFRSGGTVVTTTIDPNGAVDVEEERYRVVDSTLIVNGDHHLINATFDISGDQMIVSSEEFRAVLDRL